MVSRATRYREVVLTSSGGELISFSWLLTLQDLLISREPIAYVGVYTCGRLSVWVYNQVPAHRSVLSPREQLPMRKCSSFETEMRAYLP